MERIKYSCSNCGWETSVIAQWKDLKPKRCMNKKCNTSFRVNPEALITKDPTLNKKVEKKDTKSGKKSTSSSKQKTSSKTEQQQTKAEDSE